MLKFERSQLYINLCNCYLNKLQIEMRMQSEKLHRKIMNDIKEQFGLGLIIFVNPKKGCASKEHLATFNDFTNQELLLKEC